MGGINRGVLYRIVVFSWISILALAPATAWAATYVVESTADTGGTPMACGVGSGCTLRQVINLVNAGAGGDIVTFASTTDGTPIVITGRVNEDINAGGDFDLWRAVTITGNGEANTIIDGGGLDRVFHFRTRSLVTLENLTVRNGKLSAGMGCLSLCGGGIYTTGDVTLNSVTVSGNTANQYGGLYSFGALTMTNSTITGNTAITGGGFWSNSSLTMLNSVVSGNVATRGSVGGFSASGSVTMTNSTVSGNSSAWGNYGGFVSTGLVRMTSSTVSNNNAGWFYGGFHTAGPVIMTSSTVSNNRARAYYGGFSSTGAVTMTDSTVSGNTAQFAGGFQSAGALTMDNSTVSGNKATNSYAGGILVGISAVITNSTISGNISLMHGGGIYGNKSKIVIINSTIYGNRAPSGGGLYVGFSKPYLSNSIIANNTGGDCKGLSGGLPGDFNIDSDGSCVALDTGAGGGANDITDAGFTLPALANNGGPTMTHALLAGSPALDIGDCNQAGVGAGFGVVTTADQRSIARPSGAGCDIGAYEALSGCTDPAATNYQKTAVIDDGSCTYAAATPATPKNKKKKNKAPIYDPDGDGNHNGDEEWLVFPSANANENANVVFIWKALTDPEGTEVTYQLYVCKDGDFDNCTPTHVTRTARYAAAGAALGAGLLIFGLGFTRSGRRSMMALALALLLMTSSGALVACGGSSDSKDNGSGEATATLTCDDAHDDEVCQTSLSLNAGDYQWMVVAEDGNGKQLASGARELTVE